MLASERSHLLVLALLALLPGAAVAQRPSKPAPSTAHGAPAQGQNPLVGSWRQTGWKPCKPLAVLKPENVDWDLEELILKADGTYSVTWTPFEVYHDYWGRYTYSIARRGYNLASDVGEPGMRDDATVGPWYKGPIELVIKHGNFVPSDFSGKGVFAVRGKQLTLTDVKLGTRHAPQPLDLCERTFVRD